MNTVRSADGTRIAYDRAGAGPAAILVGGAFSYRGYSGLVKLADRLAGRFTVVRYDRRGRGDSGDTAPYEVERELDDLDALIDAAGGRAHVWGMSSGAVLALRAAARGAAIDRLAVYQPPFRVEDPGSAPPADLAERLETLLADGRRSAATRYFMTSGMGMPAWVAWAMRPLPLWSRLTAVAHTLPYDLAVMGDTVLGHPLDPHPWRDAAVPTLVLDGSRSPQSMRSAARALADVLPDARRRTLERQSHNVSMAVMAEVIGAFFAGDRSGVAVGA